MAETVGVVAAAVEFGRLVVELKGICSSIKRAPKDLSELLEELNIAEQILQACSDQHALVSRHAAPSLLQTCRQSCEKAVRDLKSVCSELIACIERSRWYGSVKSVLKKDMLERSRHKVERAKLNLLVAQEALSLTLHTLHFKQHVNTQALIQTTSSRLSSLLVAEEQVQRVDRHQITTSAVVQTATMSDNRNPNLSMARRNYIARARQCSSILQTRRLLIFQSRLLGKRFELIQQQAYGGWMYGFRTYNVRPKDSLVFGYVKEMNIIGLQQLFQTKQASIYDRDPDGLTLLHRAAGTLDPSPKMIQFLMQCGADPTVTDNFGSLPLYKLLQWLRHGPEKPKIDQALEAIDALTADYLLEELLTSLPSSLYRVNGRILQIVPHIIQVASPPWGNRDFETRLMAAYEACAPGQTSAAFWLCLSQPHLDSVCLVRRREDGHNATRYESLVGRLADLLGRYLQGEPLLPDYGGWRAVFHAAVSLGGLQSAFEHGCRSPMLSCIFMFGCDRAGKSLAAYLTSRRLTYIVQQWAYEIRLAGQDLLEYGKLEAQYLGRLKGQAEPIYPPSTFFPDECDDGVYLDTFVYGKSPNDWKIWVATSVDEPTREFWEMVEEETDPIPRVPGAWPDTVPHSSARLNRWEWDSSKRLRRRYLRCIGLTQDQHDEVFPKWRHWAQEIARCGKNCNAAQDRFLKETGITSWRSFELEYQKVQRAPRLQLTTTGAGNAMSSETAHRRDTEDISAAEVTPKKRRRWIKH